MVVGIGAGISVVTAVAGVVAVGVAPGYGRGVAVSPLGVWREPGVVRLSAVVFLGMGIFVALATWLEPLLAPRGIGADTSGLLLLAMLVAGVGGCVVVPPWAARRRVEPRVLQSTGLVIAVVCLALGLFPSATGFVVSPLLGFMLLSALPVALAMVERRDPDKAGPVTSLVWLAGNAGGLVVSLAVGWLLGAPLLAFGLLAVLGLAAAWLARLQHHEDQVPGPGRHDQLAGGGEAAVRE
ncbi:fucose permease [Actinokineospora baliensis]|nr:fucose permease [Actinokineospora baliensis]